MLDLSEDYKNKEWLYHYYVNEKKSCREIGKICNVHHCTISYWLKKFNISLRNPTETNIISLNKPEIRSKISKNKMKKWNEINLKSKHRRMKKLKKDNKLCEICDSMKDLEMSNKDHTYKEDINNWQWLCHKCHIEFDKKYNSGGN